MLRSFNKTASLSAGVPGVYVHTGPFCLRLPVLEDRSLVGARLRVSSAVSYGRNKAHAAALVYHPLLLRCVLFLLTLQQFLPTVTDF